jgi:hypothetical protein
MLGISAGERLVYLVAHDAPEVADGGWLDLETWRVVIHDLQLWILVVPVPIAQVFEHVCVFQPVELYRFVPGENPMCGL